MEWSFKGGIQNTRMIYSKVFKSLNKPAASLILENSMQKAWTSINRSLTAKLKQNKTNPIQINKTLRKRNLLNMSEQITRHWVHQYLKMIMNADQICKNICPSVVVWWWMVTCWKILHKATQLPLQVYNSQSIAHTPRS